METEANRIIYLKYNKKPKKSKFSMIFTKNNLFYLLLFFFYFIFIIILKIIKF